MFSRLSLKYRIALIIFVLESIMMAAVLWITLGESHSDSARLIRNNETAILDFVSEDSRSALITEEYIDFQTRIKGLLANSEAVGFHLTDDAGTVVASSEPMALGRTMPATVQKSPFRWEIRRIDNASGPLGVIAIKFSDEKLLKVYSSQASGDQYCLGRHACYRGRWHRCWLSSNPASGYDNPSSAAGGAWRFPSQNLLGGRR